jgi:oxygen-independent coproporphyrinogen-3 oxidase
MAGVYIHVPFCKQACHYCDFHFSTSLKHKDALVQSICLEIEARSNYLKEKEVQTIYFGGGTPSLLRQEEIQRIIATIRKHLKVVEFPEITLEANPDDLSSEKLKQLKKTEINRLSIGVQSFYERDLKFMNRAHTAADSTVAIQRAQDQGFQNLTADLIYGLPALTKAEWESSLDRLDQYGIQHISAYALTVEAGTYLHHQIKHAKWTVPDDNTVADQLLLLMKWAKQHDFLQYEISNFAKEGKLSKHNSSYWKQSWYLGVGPSAHSYNGLSRQWNVSNNSRYVSGIGKGQPLLEREVLTLNDRFNEYIMTALRTSWGVSLSYMAQQFGKTLLTAFQEQLQSYMEKEEIVMNKDQVTLSEKGKLVADNIAANLFTTGSTTA